jgi:hypothetical protein
MVAAVTEVTGKGHPTTIKYEPILLYPPHNLSPSWHCARRLMSRMSFFNVSTAILFWIVDHDWEFERAWRHQTLVYAPVQLVAGL